MNGNGAQVNQNNTSDNLTLGSVVTAHMMTNDSLKSTATGMNDNPPVMGHAIPHLACTVGIMRDRDKHFYDDRHA